MWILVRSGERILSTEAFDEIKVAAPAPGRTDHVIILNRRIDGKGFALGFYRKKEKAVEVLREIIDKQSFWINGGSDQKQQPPTAIVPPKTYIMPADVW